MGKGAEGAHFAGGMTRWIHQTLYSKFESWHQHAVTQKHRRQVAARVLLRLLHLKLARAFDRYCRNVREEIRQKSLCSRIVGYVLSVSAVFSLFLQLCLRLVDSILHALILVLWHDAAAGLMQACLRHSKLGTGDIFVCGRTHEWACVMLLCLPACTLQVCSPWQ